MNEVSLLLLLAERISLPARLTLRTLLETWRISPGLPRSPRVPLGLMTRLTATTQDIVLTSIFHSVLTVLSLPTIFSLLRIIHRDLLSTFCQILSGKIKGRQKQWRQIIMLLPQSSPAEVDVEYFYNTCDVCGWPVGNYDVTRPLVAPHISLGAACPAIEKWGMRYVEQCGRVR